jgi:hypothetical protein
MKKALCTKSITATAGRLLTGFVCVVLLGSLNVTPVAAGDKHDRREKHDNGRNRQRGHDRNEQERRREYRPDDHRGRVYAPPRVFIEPPQPPGLSIFFPPIIFRH